MRVSSESLRKYGLKRRFAAKPPYGFLATPQ